MGGELEHLSQETSNAGLAGWGEGQMTTRLQPEVTGRQALADVAQWTECQLQTQTRSNKKTNFSLMGRMF